MIIANQLGFKGFSQPSAGYEGTFLMFAIIRGCVFTLSKKVVIMHKLLKYMFVFVMVVTMVGILIPSRSHAVTLQNIRVGFHKNKQFTRVVLDLVGEKESPILEKKAGLYEVILPKGEIVPGTKLNRKFRKTYVREIVAWQANKELKVRIKLRIKRCWVKAFYLEGLSGGKKGYRLVLDFFKTKTAFRQQQIPETAGRIRIGSSTKKRPQINTGKELKGRVKAEKVVKNGLLSGKSKADKEVPGPEDKPLLPDEQRIKKPSMLALSHKNEKKHNFVPLSDDLKNAFGMPVPNSLSGQHQKSNKERKHGDLDKFPASAECERVIPKKKDPHGLVSEDRVKSVPLNDDEADVVDQVPDQAEEKEVETAENKIERAEKEISQKRYVEALSLLGSIHPEVLPENWRKKFHLASQKAAFLSEDYQFALKHLEALLDNWNQIYIDHPEVLKHTGECLYYLKKYEEAPSYLLKYYNLFPSDKGNDLLLSKVGECLLQLGEKRLAVRMFKLVVDQYNNADGALISRIRIAEILEKNKDIRDDEIDMSPEQLYEDVINNSPRNPISDIARAKLASLYYKNKKYQEGAEILNSLARRSIDSTMLLEVRSTMEQLLTDWVKDLYEKGKLEDIIHVYEVYYSYFDPSVHPEYLYYIAESYRSLKQFTEAIHYYTQALDYGDTLFQEKSMLGLGICYLKVAHPEKALGYFLKIKNPDLSAYAEFFVGKCYVELKKYSMAVKVLTKALSGKVKDPNLIVDAQWWLGFCYFQIGDIDNAQKYFEQTIATAKRNKLKIAPSRLALILYYDASCKAASNNYREAFDELKKALPLAGDEKLKKAISENLALFFIKLTSESTKNDSSLSEAMRKTGLDINKEIDRAIENKKKIRMLQERLKETKA